MDDDVRERIEDAAEADALFNALKHESDAQVDAILGPLMGENPEFREYGDEVAGVVAPVVERVNRMDRAERRERLADLNPERVAELDAEDDTEADPLGDLPNVSAYDEVRLRLAPNPNGPWHIGSARMPAVIGTYAERYDGWMLCRFDDTDPDTKRPDLEAYDAILDAIDYLGFEPDEVIYASDRVETYYEHARTLIDEGGAYACSCPAERFSELKNGGEACPHREMSAAETHDVFDAMVDGEYDAGEMTIRVRTDIEHPNPALRDWVAFRMVDRPHPREVASEYRCWPMLDFQSAIDDHLTEITHIVRGVDLQDSARRQAFLYDYFDWEYPEVVHWGHVQVDAYDVPLSTSSIKERIAAGDLDGWTDPRAPTVASLRRRGIRGEAIVDAMVELGTSQSNVDLALSSIYAANRERVDDEAPRAFLVRDAGPGSDGDEGSGSDGGEGSGDEGDTDGDVGPARDFQVVGGPDVGEPPVHPNHEDRGVRELSVENGVVLEDADVPPHGERVWLKGYGCVRHTRDSLEYTGADIDVVRAGDVDVVHWAPADGPRLRLRTMDGDVTGVAEPGLAGATVDDVVQFERVGFARLDDCDADPLVAYYAHP